MNRMSRRLAVTGCAVMAVWLLGCGGSDTEPGPNVSIKAVEAESVSMKNPQLVERATVYRDLIRETMAKEQAIDGKLASADREAIPEGEIEKMTAQKEQLVKTRLALIERYQVYIKVLVRRGVNIDDLRIEEVRPDVIPS